jgi:hypothetical protein
MSLPNNSDDRRTVPPGDGGGAGEGGAARPLDFVRRIVAEDIASGKWGGAVVTRFPPEPNGYLHIGHAKSHLPELRHRGGVRGADATCGSTTPTPPRKK